MTVKTTDAVQLVTVVVQVAVTGTTGLHVLPPNGHCPKNVATRYGEQTGETTDPN